jgi:hypothetical protein
VDASRDCVLGIMDFRYVPYALGDACTWLTKLQIVACENNISNIEIMLVTLPYRPSSPLQPHITQHNYTHVIDCLLPAFLCCDKIRSVRLFEHQRKAMHRIFGAMLARMPSWPSIWSHLNMDLDFISHKQINKFHARNGWIPKLSPPVQYLAEASKFKKIHCDGKRPFVVNIRQSALTRNPAAVNRDSPADVWLRFFKLAEDRWPEAKFILVGGFSEWDRAFSRCSNLTVPRLYGLGLGHELALLLSGNPFIGTSSGFSAAATFSNTPYVITNVEHRAAKFFEVPIGIECYPFGNERQWLSWERETDGLLEALFQRLWDSL